jgi:hypothetical protein
MLAARNPSRPNDRHFSKVSSPKRHAFADSNPNRNRFPFVHYAIGNENTLAFRFEVKTGILCEHIDGAYVPVIAFSPIFENAGKAFIWAKTYQKAYHDALSCSIGKRLAPCFARDHAQALADLRVFGKAQIS